MTRYKLAVDTGGTFTDFCLLADNGELFTGKQPSTPDDPSRAVLEGLARLVRKAGIDPREVDFLLHGTTVATNAILECKGARTALITTRGFKDLIFIGRQNRPHLYDFRAVKPPPLVRRHLVLEVEERVLADGTVQRAPGAGELESLAERLDAAGIEAVAVCLLHAYVNPEHELLLKTLLREKLPHLSVTVSSEILPEFREYERTSTTVLNALVRPRMDTYIGRLEQELGATGIKSGLYIMQSNGGVITAARARQQSARTVLSGPAGGVLAGVSLARLTGYRNLITADMGGTSMDICLIHQGEPRFTTEGNIGGYPLRLPMLDIHTIGAGGGSIAWVDAGGALRVGPQSAGAVPGPACYGLGGQNPTVTDANLVLGRLSPWDFAGERALEPGPAARSIRERIGEPLGLTLEEAAEGIIRVVNANMVRALRVVSVQRGYDPRDFTLVAFGGAGPLHAVELARELGLPRILIPPYPGVTSAWGMLSADVRHDYLATHVTEWNRAASGGINRRFDELTGQGRAELLREGFAEADIGIARFLDLRYRGQSYELTLKLSHVPLGEADVEPVSGSFHDLHRRCYGYAREDAPVEVVALRLVATGRLPRSKARVRAGGGPVNISGRRPVYLSGAYHTVPIYYRRNTMPGWETQGPAVIMQDDSTTLIWPGDRARLDRWGNVVIDTGVKPLD